MVRWLCMIYLDCARIEGPVVCVAIICLVKDIALFFWWHSIANCQPGHVKPGLARGIWIHDDNNLQITTTKLNWQRRLYEAVYRCMTANLWAQTHRGGGRQHDVLNMQGRCHCAANLVIKQTRNGLATVAPFLACQGPASYCNLPDSTRNNV